MPIKEAYEGPGGSYTPPNTRQLKLTFCGEQLEEIDCGYGQYSRYCNGFVTLCPTYTTSGYFADWRAEARSTGASALGTTPQDVLANLERQLTDQFHTLAAALGYEVTD